MKVLTFAFVAVLSMALFFSAPARSAETAEAAAALAETVAPAAAAEASEVIVNTTPERTPIQQAGDAFWGLLALVLTIVAGWIATMLPSVLKAVGAYLVERATGMRVARIDNATEDALRAGLTPSQAAKEVAAKLPNTLARSHKTAKDIEMEATVRKRAIEKEGERGVVTIGRSPEL